MYEVCGVIASQLMDRFVQTPQTSDDWLEVAADFGFGYCLPIVFIWQRAMCVNFDLQILLLYPKSLREQKNVNLLFIY